jgi:hypothetical protein
MESSLVWTSVWTGLTVGVLILIPLVLEFCKRNLPVVFGLTLVFLIGYAFSPTIPEIRLFWVPFSQLPVHLVVALAQLAKYLIS